MDTTKRKGLLYFDPDANLVTRWCLPVKNIDKAFLNRSYFNFVTKTSTKQQPFNKHRVMRRQNDNAPTVVSTKVVQMSSPDKLTSQNILKAIKSEKKSSLLTSRNQKQTDSCKSIVFPHEYSQYKDRFIDMFTPFQLMWNGQMGCITTVKHKVDLKSLTLRRLHSGPYRVG